MNGPASVILLVLGLLWGASLFAWYNNRTAPWGPYALGAVGFFFCVVLAFHVYHAFGL